MSAIVIVPTCEVEIFPTKHFKARIEERMFPITILGRAGLRVGSQKIGEIRKYTDGKTSVIIKRLSSSVAILLTGYKVDDRLSSYEERISQRITSIDGWR